VNFRNLKLASWSRLSGLSGFSGNQTLHYLLDCPDSVLDLIQSQTHRLTAHASFCFESNFIMRLMHSFLSMKHAVYLLSPPRFLSATPLRISTAAPSLSLSPPPPVFVEKITKKQNKHLAMQPYVKQKADKVHFLYPGRSLHFGFLAVKFF
jgi:hypothetical protein